MVEFRHRFQLGKCKHDDFEFPKKQQLLKKHEIEVSKEKYEKLKGKRRAKTKVEQPASRGRDPKVFRGQRPTALSGSRSTERGPILLYGI